MRRTYMATLAAGAAIVLAAAPQKESGAAAQMQAAINKQTVEGDLNGAIKQYAAIVSKYAKTDRATTAKALVRMAECYQALGDKESRKIYEQVVREYADQTEAVTTARARLSIERTAPAGVSVRQIWTASDAQRVSPDGSHLSFRADGGDVAVRDLATGENRILVHSVQPGKGASYIVWSRDGKSLAYAWSSKEIRIVNADGTGARTVLRSTGEEEVAPADWAPDSKRILITRQKHQQPSMGLEWLDVGQGTTTPIKTILHSESYDDSPWVSPDGRYVAFGTAEAPASPQQVHLMAGDGSGETTLAAHPGGEYPVGWSPDSGQVVFVSRRGNSSSLWTIPVANGKARGPARVARPVLADGSHVDSLGITRQGAFYYFSQSFASEIYTASLDPATGKVTSPPALLPLSRTGHNFRPIWSPDGLRLLSAWVENLAGATKTFREMSIFSLDTGMEQSLPEFESGVGRCWSPDGTSILAAPPLTRINLVSGEKKAIVGGPDGEICSADGKLIAFLGHDRKSIHVWDLDAGSEKEVYRAAGNVRYLLGPAISPDGSQVAFVGLERSDPTRPNEVFLRVVPASGGPAREVARVTTPVLIMGPIAWSPDGRYIYFTKSSQGAFELERVPATGGSVEGAGLKMPDIGYLSISPDGAHIAFSTANTLNWQVSAIENFLTPAK